MKILETVDTVHICIEQHLNKGFQELVCLEKKTSSSLCAYNIIRDG